MAKIHLAKSYGTGEPEGGRAHNGISANIKSKNVLDLKKIVAKKMKNKEMVYRVNRKLPRKDQDAIFNGMKKSTEWGKKNL